MSYALSYTAAIDIVSCCECGAPIALTNMQSLESTKQKFYCPNGYAQAFVGNKISNLEKELAKERQRREMAENTARAEAKRAEKAEKSERRLKKRVGNGVCTCCNRSFTNLRRHMETMHPEQKP